MRNPFSVTSMGVVLYVRLSPNASSNRLDGVLVQASGENRLKVKITVVPEKGKANQALLKLLSKKLRYPPRDLEIIRGRTDRNKDILITGEADNVIKNIETMIAALS